VCKIILLIKSELYWCQSGRDFDSHSGALGDILAGLL